MKKSECIFCKIIAGETSSSTIYEDDEFKVILDRFPSSIGHVLIMPKEHIENIFGISPKKGAQMFELAVKISPIIKKQLNCNGINILQNNGACAGQSVEHFHIHIIPRYDNDKLNICWKSQNPTDKQMEDIRKKLESEINI